MKFVGRMFLMLGLVSGFSLLQVDAFGWGADGSTDCTSNPSFGLYCKKKGTKSSCPDGCYCPGGIKTAVGEKYNGSTIAVKTWCNKHHKYLESYLNERGIFYCPDDFPGSTLGAGSIEQCHTKTGVLKYYVIPDANCTEKPGGGKYCQTARSKPKCPVKCYCPGGKKEAIGTDIDVSDACDNRMYPSRLERSGIYFCPENFRFSDSGATKIEDCYALNGGEKFYYGKISCKQGEYLPKAGRKCVSCQSGYFCSGTPEDTKWEFSLKENQGLGTCPSGKEPNKQEGATRCIDPNAVINVGPKENVDFLIAVGEQGSGSGGGTGGVNTGDTDCSAGEYLNDNGQCVSCTGNYFCPGDNNAYLCSDFGGVPTGNKKSCKATLSKNGMGGGDGRCWWIDNKDDYRSCVYGSLYDDLYYYSDDDFTSEHASEEDPGSTAYVETENKVATTDVGDGYVPSPNVNNTERININDTFTVTTKESDGKNLSVSEPDNKKVVDTKLKLPVTKDVITSGITATTQNTNVKTQNLGTTKTQTSDKARSVIKRR